MSESERRSLPEVPAKLWEVFKTYCDEEHGGSWGSGFAEMIRRNLVDPEWLDAYVNLDARITALEKHDCCKKDEEPEKQVITTCSGKQIEVTE